MRKVRVPLGVVAVVYEARPNVTIDAAALCLKSGNADRAARLELGRALERGAGLGGRARRRSSAGLPEGALSLVAGGGREELAELADPDRRRRPDHPPRRGGAEGGAEGRGDRAGDLRRVGQLPRLRRRAAPTSSGAERIVLNAKLQRPGRLQRRWRRCSCTATWPATLLPRLLATPARGGGGAPRRRADGGDRRRRRRVSARRRAADWDTEYLALELAVGVVDGVERGDRAHQPPRQRPLGGDRHPRHGRRPRLPARGRCRLRLRQRLDPVHRRRRVRDGGRDRQLDPEAPRARADRAARAVHVQVPGRGRRPHPRPDAGVRAPRHRCASASSAGRSTRRTSVI